MMIFHLIHDILYVVNNSKDMQELRTGRTTPLTTEHVSVNSNFQKQFSPTHVRAASKILRILIQY